ncbi:MAG: hypothetical protein HQM06_16395 [Magnetococcales bacterium]|nr:hypothetical protein [Magnetococcales bacterium]
MIRDILVPSRLTPYDLLPFSIRLNSVQISDEYLLDFRNIGHVEPFGMLFLSALIRQFNRVRKQEQGRTFKINAINFEDKSYASWMGLFKSFGLDYGNEPGAASGSSTYIPLTRITVSRIMEKARDDFVHHGEVIEEEARKIANLLTRSDKGPITDVLSYAIREIMRNVIEHGQANCIWYAAQYWPTKNKVEVAILDEGCGLLRSLNRNKNLLIDSNEKAIFLAMQPGISGISKDKRLRSSGEWVNSGYGLFMTSSICKIGGDFLLCSDSNAIQMSSNGVDFLPCSYKGVAIRMVIDVSKIKLLDHLLEELRIKGEQIARSRSDFDAELTASKMSRMLSK